MLCCGTSWCCNAAKVVKRMKQERGNPLHFLPQPIRPHIHFAKSEPFLSQVLQRGADMIHLVVDAEETVVGVLERIDGDGAVLRIVALQVEGELLCDAACVNLCTHSVSGSIFQNGMN